MNRRHTFTHAEESERISKLTSHIEDVFGDLAPDEVEILADSYANSTTTMVEIIEIRPRGSFLMDLMTDIEFRPVIFPKEILSLLRRRDVFLATMGHRDGRWHVLYLSPPYLETPCNVN